MVLLRRPVWSPREWIAFGIMVSILGMAGLFVGIYSFQLTGPCDNPGCNIPENLSIDHYTVQNGPTGQPSLLTIWLRSEGSYGQTVQLRGLYLKNATSSYPFTISGTIAANSIVPLSVDTSTAGFYLVGQQCYSLTLVSTTFTMNFGDRICP